MWLPKNKRVTAKRTKYNFMSPDGPLAYRKKVSLMLSSPATAWFRLGKGEVGRYVQTPRGKWVWETKQSS